LIFHANWKAQIIAVNQLTMAEHADEAAARQLLQRARRPNRRPLVA
jgi:hypothetical protein